MKKFTFRLEPLLRYRRYLEKLAQKEVTEAHANVLSSESRIAEFDNELKRTTHKLDEKMAEGLSSEEYHFYSDYLSGVTAVLNQERMHHKALMAQLVKKQSILSTKSIEKKVLENLKERRKAEYYDKMAKLDQKISEDLTIIRKVRDMGE